MRRVDPVGGLCACMRWGSVHVCVCGGGALCARVRDGALCARLAVGLCVHVRVCA